MTSKPKLSSGDVKKHKTKMEEPRISDSFQELFGTPITKTSKISPDPQKMAKEAKKDGQQKSDKGKCFWGFINLNLNLDVFFDTLLFLRW